MKIFLQRSVDPSSWLEKKIGFDCRQSNYTSEKYVLMRDQAFVRLQQFPLLTSLLEVPGAQVKDVSTKGEMQA